MIQASELRIRNYVLFDGVADEIFSLGETMCTGKKHSHWYYERIQPITLTPEILEKAGFEYMGNCNYRYKGIYIGYITTDEWFEWEYSGAMPTVSLKYIHQLQNLYFALTGEELEINL